MRLVVILIKEMSDIGVQGVYLKGAGRRVKDRDPTVWGRQVYHLDLSHEPFRGIRQLLEFLQECFLLLVRGQFLRVHGILRFAFPGQSAGEERHDWLPGEARWARRDALGRFNSGGLSCLVL